jgi:hypothetical protein
VAETAAPRLASPLAEILQAELAAGNQIAETSAWPPKCELLVILRRPFTQPYPLPDSVELEAVNDPHYWLAEYRFRGGLHTLACGFGW